MCCELWSKSTSITSIDCGNQHPNPNPPEKLTISNYYMPSPLLVLFDYFLMVLDSSYCSLGFSFHINHVIMFFTIFSNRYMLPEYSFIVFLVFPGLKCGFYFLLILSPNLSLIFWLLFNSFGCWFPIILFRIFTLTLARPIFKI